MIMHWFRHNQKIMMAVLVSMLMLAFVALPSVGRLARTGQPAVGEIRGRHVTEHEMFTMSEQMVACQRIWLGFALYPGVYADVQPMLTFVFPDRSALLSRSFRPTSDQVWRYMVLLREAEDAGVQVTSQEMADIPASESELRRAAVGLWRVVKLCQLRAAAAYITDPELWAEYAYEHERARVRFVELSPRAFEPLVEVTPEEVRAFYEEHKDVEPDPLTDVVGYQAPERVRMEYALADLEDFKKRVIVSETEVKDYYEGHKSEFVAKQDASEESAGNQGAEETGDEAQQKPDEEEAEAEAAESEEPAEVKEPSYKPLDDVKDEIRAKLLESKASEAAHNAMNSMLNDLDEMAGQFVNEPPPLGQMARRFRLRYEPFKTDEGPSALSREDVESIVPGGTKVARKLFDEEPMLNFVNVVEDTPKGPVAFMVLGHIAPAPEPFDLVQGRVRRDLMEDKALHYAQTVAGKLMQRAIESSFEEAVRETNGRLASLLGEDAGPSEGGSILKIEETDFFSRTEPTIPKMEGMRQKVVEEAFALDVDQFATVVDGGADETCYVIRKLEQEPADAADFYRDERTQRAVALYFKRARLAQQWLQALLEESPMPQWGSREREETEG